MTYTREEYERERAIVAQADAFWKRNATFDRHGSSSMSAELCKHPIYAAVNNGELYT